MTKQEINLSSDDIKRGTSIVLEGTAHDPMLNDALCLEISTGLKELAAGKGDFFVLDPGIKEGGAAFLWEDVLSLADALELIGSATSFMAPDTQAKLLIKLVLFWRKLRAVRVNLDETSFLVMLAVKRGASNPGDVCQATGLSEKEVLDTIGILEKKTYREEICLLEKDSENRLTTRF